MKKIITALLIVALSVSAMLVVSASTPSFPDITDEVTETNVAVLQMMGIISGDGGYFMPNGTLTRAAFCKMAVIAMGRGGDEPQYRSRTIFPDVKSDHWARGYINLAVTGENRIMKGNSDGTFMPDSNITYAEAVTILVRMLGYTDSDAGMLWPVGYLNLARDIGLTSGLEFTGTGAILRRDAAALFVNLLKTEVKGGGLYASKLGSLIDGAVVIDTDAKAQDGTQGAIATSKGTFKSKTGIVPQFFYAKRGTLVMSGASAVLTFIPDAGTSVDVTVSAITPGYLKSHDGTQYTIAPTTPTYINGTETVFETAFLDIVPGSFVTIYFSNDRADAVLLHDHYFDNTYVVTTDKISVSVLSSLTNAEASDITVLKNGEIIPVTEIGKYDVVTYTEGTRLVNVSDFKLTAVLENAWPNIEYPTKLTILGVEFEVVPSSAESIAKLGIGQIATFLFTPDNKVAAAVGADIVRGTPIGVAVSVSSSHASVQLANGLTVGGKLSISDYEASQLSNELVSISTGSAGRLMLTRLGMSSGTADLDVRNRMFGDKPVTQGCVVYERVGKSGVTTIAWSDLRQEKISGSKVLYAGFDSTDRVNLLVLSDVTGDIYTYGFLKLGERYAPSLGESSTERTASVRYYDGTAETTTPQAYSNQPFEDGQIGGIAVSADGDRVTGLIVLTGVTVRRSDFYMESGHNFVKIGGEEMLVAEDVMCYNSVVGVWFKSLADARAFSDTLTVYYDKPSSENGKVRFITIG